MPTVQTKLLSAIGALSFGVAVVVAYYYTVKQRRKRDEADEGIGDEDSIISDSEDPAILHDLTTPVTIAPKEHEPQFQFGKNLETKTSFAPEEQMQKSNDITKSESTVEADLKEPLISDAGANNEKPRKVLILGLDGSGKTTLIKTLTKQNDQKSLDYTPTNGFNVAQYRHGDAFFNFMEVGGAENSRAYWPNFLQGTDLLIFVIDGNDSARFGEAKDVFRDLLAKDNFRDTPCLLLSNKQDLEDAVSCADILTDAELEGISGKELTLTMTDFVCLRDKQESGAVDTLMKVMLGLLKF